MSTLSASEDGSTDTSEVTKTPSGIPIDYAFSKAASWVSVWWLPTFVTWRTIAALANEADAARRVRARSRDEEP